MCRSCMRDIIWCQAEQFAEHSDDGRLEFGELSCCWIFPGAHSKEQPAFDERSEKPHTYGFRQILLQRIGEAIWANALLAAPILAAIS